MDKAETAHFYAHWTIPVLLLLLGTWLAISVYSSTTNYCTAYQDTLPSAWLMAVGVVGLIGGRYFSHLAGEPDPKAEPYSRPTRLPEWDNAVTPGAWFLVFLLFTLIWFYEAMGTAQISFATATTNALRYEPITFYVRCAMAQDLAAFKVMDLHTGFWAPIVVFSLSGLIGHWLWASHPTERKSVESASD
jgi:hypothetical protein